MSRIQIFLCLMQRESLNLAAVAFRKDVARATGAPANFPSNGIMIPPCERGRARASSQG